MLRLENLEVHGLEPVSLEVAEGECIAVQGPSGSGKTLLLRAIADLDPAQGEVFLDDTARDAVSGPEWRRRVRYLAAEPGWWAETAGAHFQDRKGVEKKLAGLGLKPSHLDQPVSELSTGERQRLALIRAVLDTPSALLLDEPTGALDAKAAAQAERLIKTQLKAGHSVILVSHDPAQVKRLASRIFVIQGGRLKARRK